MEKKKDYLKSLRAGPANPNFFKVQPQNSGVLTFAKEETKYFEGAESDTVQQECKPLSVSWFFSEKDLAENLVLKDKVQVKNKMGVCQCPGKKLAMGRDGKAHNRDIFADVEHFR